MSIACLYHGNCFDGLCSAWVVKRKYPDALLFPMQYGEDIPNEIDEIHQIIMVDFSFKREILLHLQRHHEILVLDHHKTAQADCEGLDFCVFDMNESGASLAWKQFFPDEPMPKLVRYIADRDLWRFQQPHSDEINAYTQSYPMELGWYDLLARQLDTPEGFEQALEAGKAICRYKDSQVKQICQHYTVKEIAGYKAAVVNTCVLMSEVGHALAQVPGVQFGAYYFTRADGTVQWGARSIGNFDVSAIAKTFGGGGHKNAAGWQQ